MSAAPKDASRLSVKHLLGIEGLTRDDIRLVLDTAQSMKEVLRRPIPKVPALQGKTQVNLFFEPSTRTRTSFELAGKRLTADTLNFTSSSSSLVKGETLLDTARNIEAMHPDILIVRHPSAGAPHMLARYLRCPIINAGDGMHEHPSQALLDAFTIEDTLGRIDGLTVALVGDIVHSRVARSNIQALVTMGAQVVCVGPATFLPPAVEDVYGERVRVTTSLREGVRDADVIMMLRIQLERQAGGFFPTVREYSMRYGLSTEVLEHTRPEAIVMHPGPVNYGVEITMDVAESPRSVILHQVENGIAVRMALLYLLSAIDESALAKDAA